LTETTEEYRARIDQLESNILTEPDIGEMRSDISEGVGKTGNRQADIEIQFKDVIDNTTGKDVISAPEIIAARNGENDLKTYLDKQKESLNNLGINVKTLGAKGDGITDDTLVLQTAINENTNLFFPAGNYKITSPLTIATEGITLSGEGSNVMSETIILAVACDGIFIKNGSRYVTVENMSIRQPVKVATTKGITFGKVSNAETDSSVHYSNIENVHIENFGYGISIGINRDETIAPKFILWNCFFNKIRVDHCNNGIATQTVAGANFGLTFEKVYINGSPKTLRLRSTQANFKDCNFGIEVTNSIDIDSVGYTQFTGCNFESDVKTIETVGNLMNINGKEHEFDNCTFLFNNPAGVYPIGVYSDLESLIFNNCKFATKVGNEQAQFFSPIHCGCKDYAIKIIGSTSLPRPNFPSAYYQKYTVNRIMPMIYDSAPTPTTNGIYNLNQNRNRPEIVNKGVVTDFLGNVNLNTSYPAKIGGNFYLDGGKVTIPTGTGLTTIYYNREKAGVFMLGATTYNPASPTKRYQVERNVDPAYYEKDTYAVIKAYEWDDINKTWSNNITVPFEIQWLKVSQ